MVPETQRYVTDGGLETDLIFHHGVDLPEFAGFVLLDADEGRRLLRNYFLAYAAIAEHHNTALRLETPTWRASSVWGARLGYDDSALRRVNRDAVRFLQDIRDDSDLARVKVIGVIGPRGDGYQPGGWHGEDGADDAYRYHREQVRVFANAGADAATAYTLTDPAEAIGVVRAAREWSLPIEISFTVETDGLLASGRTLADVIAEVDAAAPPDGYLLNCAHPDHFARAIDTASASRIIGLRPNASARSHAELDGSDAIDEGDPADLAERMRELLERMPSVRVIGGCCGTDARHVARMWDALSDG